MNMVSTTPGVTCGAEVLNRRRGFLMNRRGEYGEVGW